MLAWLFFGGVALIGFLAARKAMPIATRIPTEAITSHYRKVWFSADKRYTFYQVGEFDVLVKDNATGRIERKQLPGTSIETKGVSAIARLRPFIEARKPVPSYLLNDAMAEAYENGDWRAVTKLSGMIALEAQSPEPSTEVSGTTSIVIGRNSPIDGVSNDEWQSFVDKLKTQTADYSTEKHIGAYHHHRERLTQLGIDPESLKDDDAQYGAIERDIAAYRKSERKLIDDFGGELIELPGTNASANADGSNVHCVTMSGVLGVIKSAGPKNARSWFKNPADREAHPHTTDMFLRTNGLF